MLLGKRLSLAKAVPLGGGLFAAVVTSYSHGRPAYQVELTLRTRGAADLGLMIGDGWRDSVEAAAKHAEEVLTHFASALRQAGAA